MKGYHIGHIYLRFHASTIHFRSVDGCLIHLIRKCIYIEPMKSHTDERNLEMLVLSSKLSSKLFKQQVPRTKSPSTNQESALSAESDHLTIDLYSKQTQSSIPFTFFSPFPSYSTTIDPKVAILMQLLCFEKQYPKQVGCSIELIVIKRL